MFEWLWPRGDVGRKAGDIYGAVVAQAREPAFYLDYGVPDTVIGRYEMIALHLSLVLDRMAAPGVGDEDLRRTIVEEFVVDMDSALREIGIGDASVPRNVKKAADGLYSRSMAYRQALAGPAEGRAAPEAVQSALMAHVYARVPDPAPSRVAALARYVERLDGHLQALPDAQYREGRISFPDPALQASETETTGGSRLA